MALRLLPCIMCVSTLPPLPTTDLRALRKIVHEAHAFQVLITQLGQRKPFPVCLVSANAYHVFRQAVCGPRIGRAQP